MNTTICLVYINELRRGYFLELAQKRGNGNVISPLIPYRQTLNLFLGSDVKVG